MPSITPLMVGTSAQSLVALKTPDTFTWGLNDVSASDSGRVNDENASMKKNRVAQKRKISLGWNNPNTAETAAILQATNPEYFYVRYIDAMEGDYVTKHFYRGDVSAPVKQVTVSGVTYTTLTFDIIEV